jgi:hypothetical protein
MWSPQIWMADCTIVKLSKFFIKGKGKEPLHHSQLIDSTATNSHVLH